MRQHSLLSIFLNYNAIVGALGHYCIPLFISILLWYNSRRWIVGHPRETNENGIIKMNEIEIKEVDCTRDEIDRWLRLRVALGVVTPAFMAYKTSLTRSSWCVSAKVCLNRRVAPITANIRSVSSPSLISGGFTCDQCCDHWRSHGRSWIEVLSRTENLFHRIVHTYTRCLIAYVVPSLSSANVARIQYIPALPGLSNTEYRMENGWSA